MASLDLGGAATLVVIMPVVGAGSSSGSTSLIYLLRCPNLISLLPGILGFGTFWSHAHDLSDNRIV